MSSNALAVRKIENELLDLQVKRALKFLADMETSYESGITTGVVQTQVGATVLGQFNPSTNDSYIFAHSIDANASAGNGVQLSCPALPGQQQLVFNNTAADMKLYGNGTDTINNVATATGVTITAGSTAYLFCITAGNWAASLATSATSASLSGTLSVTGLTTLAGLLKLTSVETGITASVTHTQAGAFVVSATKLAHSVDTVGTGGDTVSIGIAATVGAVQFVANTAAANALQLYGLGTDTINKVATATGISVAAGKNALLYCVTAGDWRAIVA